MARTLLSATLALLTAVGLVAGAAIERRAVIAHDQVVGFPETVPNTNVGQLYLKYKPHLKVVNGCVPFPAVDAEGNTSGGLAPTGDPSGGCSSSTGQVYARSASFNNAFAILYAWYMPKDEPSSGLGHRHDWEGIVVWIDDPNKAEPTLLGVAASAHGDFDTTTSPNLSGTSPLIRYFSIFPVDHQLGFTSDVGGTQPLIAYESLTDAARNALETTDFGSANVLFKDANFQNNLQKAEL
ncbi:necrosis inducing protein-domain-containing protein [Daedaleopsis nitida]|nr:necrosis inducing protein-domain-containing protein [Daedaleopsis nitida]